MPRQRAAPLLAALWSIIAVLAVISVVRRPDVPRLDGRRDTLTPLAHRANPAKMWLLLRLANTHSDALAIRGADPSTGSLLAAGVAIAQALPDERVPVAPPANAVAGWLDVHGLYLLPEETHDELANRLDPDRIATRIQGLRAVLSSPLFGVSGIEARRDPLALRELLHAVAGRLGHLNAPNRDPMRPTPTGNGDLLAANGNLLAVQIHSDRSSSSVANDARAAVAGLGVELSVVGPAATVERGRAHLSRTIGFACVATVAAWTFIISLASRSVRGTLCLAWFATGSTAILLVVMPRLDVFSLPLLVTLVGFAVALVLADERQGRRFPAVGLIAAMALFPLAICPYPVWKEGAVWWVLGALITLVPAGTVVRGLGVWVKHRNHAARHRFVPTPPPRISSSIVLALIAAGIWSFGQLPHIASDAVASPDAELQSDQHDLARWFFDPANTVEIRGYGDTAAAALERAAADTRLLAYLVPTRAVRLDSPGTFVATDRELLLRRKRLTQLGIMEKMRSLRLALESQGLRPNAFAESVAGVSSLDATPNPQAALDSALGPWIRRYLSSDKNGVYVRSFVQLRPGTAAESALAADAHRSLTAFGLRVAGWRDAAQLGDTLILTLATGLWLGAFISWVSSRKLAIALGLAATAAAAAAATVIALHLVFNHGIGPLALPGLLLAAATTFFAGLPASTAALAKTPISVPRLLWAVAALVAGVLALVLSAEPIWQRAAVVLASGAAIGAGLGVFVAPGVCLALSRARTTGHGSDERNRP
ncbi:MAG: hypothetical protein V3V08_14170 [Nannocystaceae bacterium]